MTNTTNTLTLHPYRIAWKHTLRARTVHTWLRFSPSIEAAREDAIRLVSEETYGRGVVVTVTEAPDAVNSTVGVVAHEVRERATVDESTARVVRNWLASYNGDVEATALWMSRSLRLGSLPKCRGLVEEAVAMAPKQATPLPEEV